MTVWNDVALCVVALMEGYMCIVLPLLLSYLGLYLFGPNTLNYWLSSGSQN